MSENPFTNMAEDEQMAEYDASQKEAEAAGRLALPDAQTVWRQLLTYDSLNTEGCEAAARLAGFLAEYYGIQS